MKKYIKFVFLTMLAISFVTVSGCKWFKKHDGGDSAPSKFNVEWIYGGVNGAVAVEDTSATGYKLNSVKFDGTGSMWGNTHDKPKARNCLFFKDGKTYYGGFFEWGDPTRTSRAIDNINGKYKGWDPAKVANATEFAYCITDKSGKKRSNFVFCSKRDVVIEISETEE